MYGIDEDAYEILVGKAEEKIPLGIPRCRLDDNIKMDLKDHARLWIGFIRLRIMANVNTVINLGAASQEGSWL
jgi:hypothetical protein